MSGLRKPATKNRDQQTEAPSKNVQPTAPKQALGRKLKRSEMIDQAVSDTHNQWLSSEHEDNGPRKEVYKEEEIPLGSILLDKANHRTRHISVAHPTKNLLPENHPDYQKNEDLIKNLIEFAEHLKHEPLRQAPGIYWDKGKPYTAYGNRRFLALLIAFGPKYVYRFKVYPKKPRDLAKARFQENAQREDVPLSDKILDFEAAQREAIAVLESENKPTYAKDVSKRLGISGGAYSVYERALKSDLLVKLIAEGKIKEFRLLRELVSVKKDEEILSKLGITEQEESGLEKEQNKVGQGRGRPKKNVQFPKIASKKVFKDIVDGRLSEFEWCEEDFESFEAMTAKLNACIEQLLSQE